MEKPKSFPQKYSGGDGCDKKERERASREVFLVQRNQLLAYVCTVSGRVVFIFLGAPRSIQFLRAFF